MLPPTDVMQIIRTLFFVHDLLTLKEPRYDSCPGVKSLRVGSYSSRGRAV